MGIVVILISFTIILVELTSYCTGSYPQYILTTVLSVFVILLALYHLLVEISQMIYSITDYFKAIQNYVQLALFPLSIMFVFTFPNHCGCPTNWQWQIGIFVVLLAWINLIFFASKFPSTGVYVLVFRQISITFFKVAAFSIILIMGFSLILFMMFNTPGAEVR